MEEYVEVPSDSGITFNVKPKMKALEITEKARDSILSHKFDQVRVNLPNSDMVGHTGDTEATVVACKVADEVVKVMYHAEQKRAMWGYDEEDDGRLKENSRIGIPANHWISVYSARLPPMKQRYHHDLYDSELVRLVGEGHEDGLFISSVASCIDRWTVVMDAGTSYTSQLYFKSNVFLPKDWIEEHWKKNYYISSIAGSSNGKSIIMMSKGTSSSIFSRSGNVDCEPSIQPISKLEFEFERRKLTKDDIQELIYREILEYHPQMLQEYLRGAEPTSFMYPRRHHLVQIL